jgi:hypothetical protein
VKEHAFLIIKADSAEAAMKYAIERFADKWSDWNVQGVMPQSTSSPTNWSMEIFFPFDLVLDVGAELGKWYVDPNLSEVGETGFPVGTLLYYAKA